MFEIDDDLNVNNESYPDQKFTPRPPMPGNYLIKASSWKMKTKKDGSPMLWKDKYPVVALDTVEITDPLDYNRKVGVFVDVPTMPFEREGKLASQIADLLRAMDADATASNTGEVLREVTDRLNQGIEFRARIDYSAYDGVYAKQAIAELADPNDKKAVNAVYKKARVTGYKNILKQNRENGKPTLPATQWVGPSGEVIDVRPTITAFYPANDAKVNLGPDKALLEASKG